MVHIVGAMRDRRVGGWTSERPIKQVSNSLPNSKPQSTIITTAELAARWKSDIPAVCLDQIMLKERLLYAVAQ